MPLCANCGTNNVEGVRFCVSCGSQVGEAPPPESWRASSDLGSAPSAPSAGGPAGPQPGGASGPSSYAPPDAPGYTPNVPPQSNFPAYTPQPPGGSPYYQEQQPPASQPMHPAVPAIVSLFLPGIGLLFVPNKAGLGLAIFAGAIVYTILAVLLTFVVVGVCLLVVGPLINVAAAVHSWDEAAKASGGQFQPVFFK